MTQIENIVRDIANQVCDERDNKLKRHVESKINDLYDCLSTQPEEIEDAPSTYSTLNAGLRWTPRQESELIVQFAKACEWIAYKQKRNVSGIKSRLRRLINEERI